MTGVQTCAFRSVRDERREARRLDVLAQREQLIGRAGERHLDEHQPRSLEDVSGGVLVEERPRGRQLVPEPQLQGRSVAEPLEGVEDPISLETPVGDGESLYGDLIEDTHSDRPDEATAVLLRSAELSDALLRLAPRMRHVLCRRFGLDGETPQTLEEVGADLGITRERVRQLESRALRELRNVAPGLQLYLRAE